MIAGLACFAVEYFAGLACFVVVGFDYPVAVAEEAGLAAVVGWFAVAGLELGFAYLAVDFAAVVAAVLACSAEDFAAADLVLFAAVAVAYFVVDFVEAGFVCSVAEDFVEAGFVYLAVAVEAGLACFVGDFVAADLAYFVADLAVAVCLVVEEAGLACFAGDFVEAGLVYSAADLAGFVCFAAVVGSVYFAAVGLAYFVVDFEEDSFVCLAVEERTVLACSVAELEDELGHFVVAEYVCSGADSCT